MWLQALRWAGVMRRSRGKNHTAASSKLLPASTPAEERERSDAERAVTAEQRRRVSFGSAPAESEGAAWEGRGPVTFLMLAEDEAILGKQRMRAVLSVVQTHLLSLCVRVRRRERKNEGLGDGEEGGEK
eukprot:1108611-Rhodomonas_salina.1